MFKKLFNDNWLFTKQEIGIDLKKLKSSETVWYEVELPHDWLIYDTKNLYQTGEGWYKKSFYIEGIKDQVVRIYFEGVYMNSTLYVNGKEVGGWTYGYSSFEFDITEYLNSGENTILVRVQHRAPNSRWYSGAGIYRNVYLKTTPKTYLVSDGIYIITNGDKGKVTVSTELNINTEDELSRVLLRQSIIDAEGTVLVVKDQPGKSILENNINSSTPCNVLFHENELQIDSPKLWDLDASYCYILKTEVLLDGKLLDEDITTFGFRSFQFDPNDGFSLNGKYIKLHGVCLHHDLGSLGAAMNKSALERQLRIMKEMGVNAIRTSHNMPAVELMEICDQIGLLVVSEAFDMWEMSKTEYDNARFFPTTYERDVASWVRRDRNHPSLIMWSIGNEIPDTHASLRGLEITKNLKNNVLKHDPCGNGVITIGSNYIAWENAQKVAEELTYSGYNYGEYLYDSHHEKFPHWIIYGSETASTVRSRGIYHFPAATPILTHDDNQCSSLDNSAVGWGAKSSEWAWIWDRDRKFCAGQFIWTGFDYIGEPTPYSTKNSYFGIVDTAGIPKDIYYMYQGEWTDYKKNPMVHLLPYWDFNIGQLIDIMAYTNAPKVELFLNGKSMGVQEIDHEHGTILHGHWLLNYEPGTLLVKAYDESGNVIAEDSTSSFGDPVKLSLKADKTSLKADGRDLSFIEISAYDSKDLFVANARNRVEVQVSGAGRLVGLDNGDPTDYDDYKGTNRRLFSGKLVAVVESTLKAGEIKVKIKSKGLEETSMKLYVEPYADSVGVHVVNNNPYQGTLTRDTSRLGEVPVRKIELSIVSGDNKLTQDKTTAKIQAKLYPETATYSDLEWKVVNVSGIEINIANLTFTGNEAVIEGLGDGDCRLRCMCKNGREIPEIISELEFNISGLGAAVRNPYEFNAACFYKLSNIPLNVVKDGAISGIHQRTFIGFTDIDFGKTGSDRIKLYVGNSGGNPVPIEIWEGMPEDKDGRLITKVMFEVNGQWDGFLPSEFELPEPLTGMKTISFVVEDKIIFGGFEFIQKEKAYEKLFAATFDKIYGDSYKIIDNKVENIGNNVVLEYENMDFSMKGFTKIKIKGKTPTDNNTIHVRFNDKDGNNLNQIIEFSFAEVYTEREYELKSLTGLQKVSFIFLPGSNFDFEWFQFV
jgi:beta-galactosidase